MFSEPVSVSTCFIDRTIRRENFHARACSFLSFLQPIPWYRAHRCVFTIESGFFFSFLFFFYARPVVCSFCEDSRIYETVTLPRNDRVSIECEGYEHNCGGTMKFMTRPYRFFVLFLSLLLNIERNDAIIL